MELSPLADDISMAISVVGEHPADVLTERERAIVARSKSEKRRAEFTAGRVAAKSALLAFGLKDFEILKGPKGAPMWPEKFVGSITHSGNHSVAVAAKRTDYSAIGIDLQQATEASLPSKGAIHRICSEEERSKLDTLSESEQALMALRIFSAKECVHKALRAYSETEIPFHSVSISKISKDKISGSIVHPFVGMNPQPEELTWAIQEPDGYIFTALIVK